MFLPDKRKLSSAIRYSVLTFHVTSSLFIRAHYLISNSLRTASPTHGRSTSASIPTSASSALFVSVTAGSPATASSSQRQSLPQQLSTPQHQPPLTSSSPHGVESRAALARNRSATEAEGTQVRLALELQSNMVSNTKRYTAPWRCLAFMNERFLFE